MDEEIVSTKRSSSVDGRDVTMRRKWNIYIHFQYFNFRDYWWLCRKMSFLFCVHDAVTLLYFFLPSPYRGIIVNVVRRVPAALSFWAEAKPLSAHLSQRINEIMCSESTNRLISSSCERHNNILHVLLDAVENGRFKVASGHMSPNAWSKKY